MIPLYTRDAVYRLDRQAMTLDAQPSLQLMARAARAAWNRLTQRWPEARRLLILAGPGNNGGDAFALALYALQARLEPRVVTLGDLHRQSVEARRFREAYVESGGRVETWSGNLPAAEVLVDGLLGIGLDKPLRADWLALIDAVNAHPAPVLAIDIPSGLDAESGRPLPRAVRAAVTVTYIARKVGQYLADGPDHCGELRFEDLGLSSAARRSEAPAIEQLEAVDLRWPAPRRRNSHKYDQGSVLVIGGDRGMAGAAILSGLAALKAGAGLVRMCIHPQQQGSQLARAPELMCCGWDELERHLARASHLIVGPGLGNGERAQALLRRLQIVDKPMLIDADALHPDFIRGLSTRQRLLTPHAGEAARLLGCGSRDIAEDRLAALRQLSEDFRASVLLKGADSLVGSPGATPKFCLPGHPGMATAGMGDLLSGIAAALWAQGLEAETAVATASSWQAVAASRAVSGAWPATLTATAVLDHLGEAAQQLQEAGHG